MRAIDGVLRSLGAVGLLVGLTFACGNDTQSDPDEDDDGSGGSVAAAGGNGGTGNTDAGGSGGSAGPSTSSGTTNGTTNGAGGMSTAATAVTSNTTASTTGAAGAGEVPEPMPGLAEPCAADDDCESDLICLSADSNSLIAGGPANGLCTAPCNADSPCGADAACITFGASDADGYCMPMCIPGNGVHDCAGRFDLVCDILPVGVACTSNAECGGGTACLVDAGECVLPVCLPKCGFDSDCPEGRFCDASVGECVAEAPAGSGLDQLCDPEAEEDECLGFCAGTGEEARCMETCVLGAYPTCGSESEDNATAECLLPYVGDDDGDLGFCLGLCDCSSDCTDDGMVCRSFESVEGFSSSEVRGRPGFCTLASEELAEEAILDCEE